MSISMSIAKVVQIIGFWLVTERDPALAHREPPITARTLARYTSIIVAGLTIAVYLSGGQPSSSGRLHLPALAGASPAVRVSAQLLVAALSILSIAALLRYARTLALRLPDERIARQCAGVAIVLSITLGIAALLNAYFAITGTRPRGSFAGSPLSALRAMVSLATGLGMWWCMLLIFNFRRQLAQAAHRARESWARPLR
jgi:hypothetical protein